ncbi:hypothetical protein PM082_016440 [Marasmius tenuissimus]|nr:hypothetical protein PM082_016440 [Marasmius tenuissimus]
MASPSLFFPSISLQVLSSLIFFLGVTIVTHCLSRRLATVDFSLSGILELPWSRLCLLLVFIDSWLFLFTSGVLTFGVGLEVSHAVCDAAINICITCYSTSKLLIYLFLIERVHVVWAPTTGSASRFKSAVDRICLVTVALYGIIITLLFLGRISHWGEGKEACVIGLKPLSSIPLLSYDLYINFFLTGLFFWPLLKSGHLTEKIKSMAIRALVAAIVALTTSTVNIVVLTSQHGRELGWVCLGSCGADVIVNAAALYWATLPKKQRQRAPTLSVISRDLGNVSLFTVTRSAGHKPSLSVIIPPQAVRCSDPHEVKRASDEHYNNPFTPVQFVSKSHSSVRITAHPELANPPQPRGILKSVSDYWKRPEAPNKNDRPIEVTVTTQHEIEEEIVQHSR